MGTPLQEILGAISKKFAQQREDKLRAEDLAERDKKFQEDTRRFDETAKTHKEMLAHQNKISEAQLALATLDASNKIGESYYKTGHLPAGVKKTGNTYEQNGAAKQFSDVGTQTNVQNPSDPSQSTLAGAVLDKFIPMEQTGITARHEPTGVDLNLEDPGVAATRQSELDLIRQEPLLQRDEARQNAQMDRQLAVDKQRFGFQEKNEAQKMAKVQSDKLAFEEVQHKHKTELQTQNLGVQMAKARLSADVQNRKIDAVQAASKLKQLESAIPKGVQDSLLAKANLKRDFDKVNKFFLENPKTVEELFPKNGFPGQAMAKIAWNNFKDKLKQERGQKAKDLLVALENISAGQINKVYGAALSPTEAARANKWAFNPGSDNFETFQSKLKEGSSDSGFMFQGMKRLLKPSQLEKFQGLELLMEGADKEDDAPLEIQP